VTTGLNRIGVFGLICLSFLAGDPFILQFDASRIVVVEGVLNRVQIERWYASEENNLVALVVESDGGEIHVDLGPAGLHHNDPQPGQTLKAEGSLVTVGEKRYLLTTELKLNQGATEVRLRNEQGVPTWLEKRDRPSFHRRFNRMKRMKRMRH